MRRSSLCPGLLLAALAAAIAGLTTPAAAQYPYPYVPPYWYGGVYAPAYPFRPGGLYFQSPLQPAPFDTVYPFGPYGLFYDYAPPYLGGPQPTGHGITWSGPNSYVYRPIYGLPGAAPSAPVTAAPGAVGGDAGLPPPAPPQPDVQHSGYRGPAPSSVIVDAETRLVEASADLRSGRYDAALVRLDRLLAQQADNGYAHMLRCHALFALGRYDQSADALRQALPLMPDDAWGRMIVHYRDTFGTTRQYTDRLRALELAVQQNPQQASTRLLLGYHYAYLGFKEAGLIHLRAAADLLKLDQPARRLVEQLEQAAQNAAQAHQLPLQ